VREAVAFALLACACGASPCQTPSSRGAAVAPNASAPAAGSGQPDPDFDALAARGRALAPGMREVARKDSNGERLEMVRAETRDACVRVAFTSTSPVIAKLVDREGRLLAASHEPTTEGMLGERGPVCVRKGDVVAGMADGAPAHVLWVAWEAP
jgi:hypothetical protein